MKQSRNSRLKHRVFYFSTINGLVISPHRSLPIRLSHLSCFSHNVTLQKHIFLNKAVLYYFLSSLEPSPCNDAIPQLLLSVILSMLHALWTKYPLFNLCPFSTLVTTFTTAITKGSLIIFHQDKFRH